MDSNFSLSDLAAVTNNEGCGNSWILILLFAMIFGWGGNGFGNGNRTASDDIQRAMDLNSVLTGQRDLAADMERGFSAITNNDNHNAYDNLSEMRDIQGAVATGNANIINNLTAMAGSIKDCCCTTQRAIDGVNYNLATQSAAIQQNDTANTQKILDALAQNREQALRDRIQTLELNNAMCGVVRYPSATTYSSGGNPFCGCSCN